MLFDHQKLADMVAEKARLTSELQQASVQCNDLYATDEDWSGGGRLEKYMAANQRHGQLTRELKTVSDRLSAYELREPKMAKSKFNTPLSRWIRRGNDGLDADEKELYLGSDTDIQGGRPGFTIGMADTPGSGTASDATSGQETVQEQIVPRVIDRLAHFGGVAKMGQRFMTGGGGDYAYIQEDNASQYGEFLAQNAIHTDASLSDFGVITFGATKCSSKSIFLTNEMTQDAVFDVEGYANRTALRRMGRSWDQAFTATQVGTGLPEGVVTGAMAGITAAGTAAITWKETQELPYKINRAYREGMGEEGEEGFMPEMGGQTGYLMSDDCERAMRVLVDGDSRPLWQASTREGAPNMLNGEPYQIAGHMDSLETGKVPMLYGNFSYYAIRTVGSVRMYNFWDSRTAQRDVIEILAFSRRDGRYCGAVTGGVCEAVAKMTMT